MLTSDQAAAQLGAIAHIQRNKREFDLIACEFALDKWWVQLTRGAIKSRPAVHAELAYAYAMALAHFEEMEK